MIAPPDRLQLEALERREAGVVPSQEGRLMAARRLPGRQALAICLPENRFSDAAELHVRKCRHVRQRQGLDA